MVYAPSLVGCTPAAGTPGPALSTIGALKNGGPRGPAAAVSRRDTFESSMRTEADASKTDRPGPAPPETTEFEILKTPSSGPGDSSYLLRGTFQLSLYEKLGADGEERLSH